MPAAYPRTRSERSESAPKRRRLDPSLGDGGRDGPSRVSLEGRVRILRHPAIATDRQRDRPEGELRVVGGRAVLVDVDALELAGLGHPQRAGGLHAVYFFEG